MLRSLSRYATTISSSAEAEAAEAETETEAEATAISTLPLCRLVVETLIASPAAFWQCASAGMVSVCEYVCVCLAMSLGS